MIHKILLTVLLKKGLDVAVEKVKSKKGKRAATVILAIVVALISVIAMVNPELAEQITGFISLLNEELK